MNDNTTAGAQADPEAYTDKSVFVPPSGGGILNAFTGFLSKAADTAIDVFAIRNTGGGSVGSVYPTGQVNPAAAASQNNANAEAARYDAQARTTQLIIGGVAVSAMLMAFVYVTRTSRK